VHKHELAKWSEFLAMGGYGLYAGSYAVTLIVLIGEIAPSCAGRRDRRLAKFLRGAQE
jgi:heme exporter protein CcmD